MIKVHQKSGKYEVARDALIPYAEKIANSICQKTDESWGKCFIEAMDKLANEELGTMTQKEIEQEASKRKAKLLEGKE